jgi:FtsP/CotA-like multicopper oxidase with cupredoxin domain
MNTIGKRFAMGRWTLALAVASALAAGGCGKFHVGAPNAAAGDGGHHDGAGGDGGHHDDGGGGGYGGGGEGGGGGAGGGGAGGGVGGGNAGGPPCDQRPGQGGQPIVVDPDVYLVARSYEIPAGTFGNAAPIAMWGFVAADSSFNPLAGAGPVSPGPTLYQTEGTQLRIHVRNDLEGPYVEPVSVVIPGQTTTMRPVWFDPASGTTTAIGARPPGDVTSRVRSFTTETPPDHATVVTYTFPSLKAGTYLYESGTHPAVQVQMGLFGELVVVPSGAPRVYGDVSTAFDWSASLVLSEIDPDLHAAIASGQYGPAAASPVPAGWKTSTVDYHPRYFLVNGAPYTPGALPIVAGWPGARVALRLLNAGLATKVPLLLGPYLSVVGEDGHFISVTDAHGAVVPAPRQQYEVMLAAGKTVDALFTAGGEGLLPVFDRRLDLTNAGASPGGMLSQLQIYADEASARAAAQGN